MSTEDPGNDQLGSASAANTNFVTHADLLRVVEAYQATNKLCTTMAEAQGYDAVEMRGYNEHVSGLASDLRSKIRAQVQLQNVILPVKFAPRICRADNSQEKLHNASKEAEEHGDAGTKNTNLESVVATLATTVTNVSTRGLTPEDLYAVQKAVSQLKTILKDSRAKARSNDTVMLSKDGASQIVADLSTMEEHLIQISLKEHMAALRADVAGLGDI